MFESRHKTLFLKKNKTETPAKGVGKKSRNLHLLKFMDAKVISWLKFNYSQ